MLCFLVDTRTTTMWKSLLGYLFHCPSSPRLMAYRNIPGHSQCDAMPQKRPRQNPVNFRVLRMLESSIEALASRNFWIQSTTTKEPASPRPRVREASNKSTWVRSEGEGSLRYTFQGLPLDPSQLGTEPEPQLILVGVGGTNSRMMVVLNLIVSTGRLGHNELGGDVSAT